MLTLNSDTMILRNRNELKTLFKNDRFLSEKQFADLIDSMLNKHDDQFHGLWKPGQTYHPGDVVIYQGAFWEMNAPEEICSQIDKPPSQENDQWQSLMIPLTELTQDQEQTQQELETLRQEFNLYQEQMEARLQQLTERIEQYEA